MGRTPGAFRGQRSLAEAFTESGENSIPLPSLHPQYIHRSLHGHSQSTEACPHSLRTADVRGVCKLAGALPSAPPANLDSSLLLPSATEPFSQAGSSSPQMSASTRPAHAACACPPAEAPLNGPHRGPPASTLLLHPDPGSHHSEFSSNITFPRDFLWPPY